MNSLIVEVRVPNSALGRAAALTEIQALAQHRRLILPHKNSLLTTRRLLSG